MKKRCSRHFALSNNKEAKYAGAKFVKNQQYSKSISIHSAKISHFDNATYYY